MADNLGVLRIAKKAGRLVAGEESVGIAARGKKARLIITAADASERTVRRAAGLADTGNTIHLPLSNTKEELGAAVGKVSCAILAFTDFGLAACFVEKLAAADPAQYEDIRTALSVRAVRSTARKQKKQKNKVKTGIRRSKNG